MKKKFPEFKTDKEAENFVDTADLREYDFSDMRPVRFEFKPKDAAINLRLPKQLLDAVHKKAKKMDVPYQRFIRLALERMVKG
jgi:predicted DNA binding CopG/RHH family protein